MSKVPKHSPDDSDDFEQRIHKLLGYSSGFPQPTTTRFTKWELGWFKTDDRVRSRFLAVGLGERRTTTFSSGDRDLFLTWLGSDNASWVDDLRDFFREPPDADPPMPSPDLEGSVASFIELLASTGDLGMTAPVSLIQRSFDCIDILMWIDRLYALRSALRTAIGLIDFDLVGITEEAIDAALEQRHPGITDEVRTLYQEAADVRATLTRLFFLAGNEWLLRGRLVPSGDRFGPPRPVSAPISALEDTFFVMAASVGAIQPPSRLPGVFRCEYHLCRRVFTSYRRGVGGKYRFCCIQHGKRFYAARRMKEKSKKAQRDALAEEQ